MKHRMRFVSSLLLSLCLLNVTIAADRGATDAQVLVTVGGAPITAADLEMAIASSPFATPFNTLGIDDQAAIRGNMLQRLVTSRLLALEARQIGLDQSERFRTEQEDFRLGLLYRGYMDGLRASIEIPADVSAAIRQQFIGDVDARRAAESAYQVDRFRALRTANLLALRQKYHVATHDEAIRPDAPHDTSLLEADGIRITLGDLLPPEGMSDGPLTTEWLRERLVQRAELLLVAREAEQQGIDIAGRQAAYLEERLPALLIEEQEKVWLADEQVLRDYFAAHPEYGRLVDRWHIGQLVVATRAEAEALRLRIGKGESLFELAGAYSIDPYGRSHSGDMGWVKAGQGMPEVERAIAALKDGEVSEVVPSPLGFHLITIIERRPGETRPYEFARDKVRQAYVSERMADYMGELASRHAVVWKIGERQVTQN